MCDALGTGGQKGLVYFMLSICDESGRFCDVKNRRPNCLCYTLNTSKTHPFIGKMHDNLNLLLISALGPKKVAL